MIEVKDLAYISYNEKLENVCYTLYLYNKKNIDAYYDFYGTKIYSKDINNVKDIELMFQKIYGCSYQEKAYKRVLLERDDMLKRGYSFLPEEMHQEWKEYIDSVLDLLPNYHIGNPVYDALQILAFINDTYDVHKLSTIIAKVYESKNPVIIKVLKFNNKSVLVKQIIESLNGNHNNKKTI